MTAINADSRGLGLRGSDAVLLLLGEPAQVLERIVPDDPLALADHVAVELRKAAFVLDPEKVLRRAFARCAHGAAGWRGEPPLTVWLGARVREAIEDVRRAELCEPMSGEGLQDAFGCIADPLGLRSEDMRHACSRFNRLEPEVRAALLRVLVEGDSLDELAGELGSSIPEVARRVRRGLESFRAAFAPRPTLEVVG